GGYDVARNAALFARLKDDGSVDDSFRDGGAEALPGSVGMVTDLLVRGDGDVMAAGLVKRPRSHVLNFVANSLDNESRTDGGSTLALARFKQDGSADASFGTGGVATAAEPAGGFLQHVVARELDDGTFTVAGGSGNH